LKSDLDRLMNEKGMDGILVFGNGDHNPSMVYLTGGGHFTTALLIKKQGVPPVLIVNSMEREEAARTGLQVETFDFELLLKLNKANPNQEAKCSALFYQHYLEKYGMTSGRVGLYGTIEIRREWAILNELKDLMPDLHLIGEPKSVLDGAALHKDKTELDRIRNMGAITTKVVGRVRDYLTSNTLKDGILVDETGKTITIGDVKSRVDLWLAEAGAENPEGTIFSIGRDAGVCHSTGTATDALRAGQSIIFDIFPCEKGGGYFYDFTRTWSLGYASPEVQKHYDQVKKVYDILVSELKPGVLCQDYQKRTCELFEEMGHPTIATDPNTTVGYNHSLGHGVGLRVHEGPWFSQFVSEKDKLEPGMVFTLEPGLYYPNQGFGVRLEDTYYVDENGKFNKFVDFPMDLILPVKGS